MVNKKKFREHLCSLQVGAEKPTQACRPSKAAVPETKSKLKIFTKFAKIFKSKISKICSTVLYESAHNHCVQKKIRENRRKTVG